MLGCRLVPTAVVTDSNSQITAELAERFDIAVVPIPIVLDGVEYLEGIDLDADQFYERFVVDESEVTTSQPSPGRFASVYELCAAKGCDEIISVHVTAAMSGTLNSARLGAAMVDADVHLVDSRTASFGVACCAWQAASRLHDGASTTEAVRAAEQLADRLFSVTALGATDLLAASGRAVVEGSTGGVDVFLASPGGSFESVGAATSPDAICDLMASTMCSDGAPIVVALGIADRTAAPFYEGLEARLAARPDVVEIVRYRVGPSVGAFTGPGAAGGFWYPVDV